MNLVQMQIIERVLDISQLILLNSFWHILFVVKARCHILRSLFCQFLHKSMHSVDSNPAEGRLLIMSMIGLFNQTNGLKHVCDIVEPSYLGFQLLSLFNSHNISAEEHLLVLLCQL